MELICPSCEARYQIPDGSIGEKGRQVSCMNCGHGWHAFPPLILGAPSQMPGMTPPPAPVTPQHPAAAMGRAAASPRIHGDSDPAWDRTESDGGDRGGNNAIRSDLSRNEQLAEIRDMLAEVQSEERVSAQDRNDPGDGRSAQDRDYTLRHEADALATTAPPVDDHYAEPDPQEADDEPEMDPLRRRMQMHEERNAPAPPPNVDKLRRKHERKERKIRHKKAAGSGAFMTGFLLVIMIAAVLIAAYMLHPQIIERVPGMEPALTDYVETVDGLRVSVAETFASMVAWVTEKLG